MIEYFDSIGEIELTMTPGEVARYQGIQILKKGLRLLVVRWREAKEFKKAATSMTKFYRGWKARINVDWVLERPLNLRERPVFRFLKEQKYLVKHILLKQTELSTEVA